MSWFIKTESFTSKTLRLPSSDRRKFLAKHKEWVAKLHALGTNISSGYLVDENKKPGGGGVLIIEATSYEDAIALIKQDPMIIEDLVTWKVQEWLPVFGQLLKQTTLDK
tara:strand:+ start:11547 stop:11873 length:327 start_codon:yes stop_codon:yes gene_type:complete